MISVLIGVIILLGLVIWNRNRFIKSLTVDLRLAQAQIIVQQKPVADQVPELKKIIMDNRMRRISEGKRTSTPSDLDWIKRHAPVPPVTRVVTDDDSLARSLRRNSRARNDDSSIYAAASVAAYSTPSSNYDSGDSCDTSTNSGGLCD